MRKEKNGRLGRERKWLMTEIDAIESAYRDATKTLYNSMLSAFSTAGGDKAAEEKAKEAFKRGLELNKKAYTAAKVIIESQDKVWQGGRG